MKVLIEVPLKKQDDRLKFAWINNKNNWLFIIENDKSLKTFSVEHDPGKELHFATLAEEKTCTGLTWNKDGSLLALVVDKSQIYFWEVIRNNFKHFKIKDKHLAKMVNHKMIETLIWSKVSNKLAFCYSTGQILLFDYDTEFSERFVDNSKGILSVVKSIEASEEHDIFVCISEISEILVMTFSGEVKFYIQCEDITVVRAKLSPISFNYSKQYMRDKILTKSWLTYQSHNDKIFLREIFVNESCLSENSAKSKYMFNDENYSKLIDFGWINSSTLIICFSSGLVKQLQLIEEDSEDQQIVELVCQTLLSITDEEKEQDDNYEPEEFKSYVFSRYNRLPSTNRLKDQAFDPVSVAAVSDHRLIYYELVEDESQGSYSFEKVDDLDLTESLKKVDLALKRVEWCFDCSLLAVQLSNGHILVYKSRLKDYMLAQCGSKVAYLSDTNEVTVLNYDLTEEFDQEREEIDDDAPSYSRDVTEEKMVQLDDVTPLFQERSLNEGNALTVNVDFKPSILAIGPLHLAAALNNRVRFYNLGNDKLNSNKTMKPGLLVDEQEYISIVVALSLSSRFVAVYFNDGRLKLHPIQSNLINSNCTTRMFDDGLCSGVVDNEVAADNLDERFFPDPVKPERISTFTLTEELLVYCSHEYNVNVFSLRCWSIVQVCEHTAYFEKPIIKLRANFNGNKFVCFTSEQLDVTDTKQVSDNVFLYDLYTNSMTEFYEDNLWNTKIFEGQASMKLVHDHMKQEESLSTKIVNERYAELKVKRARAAERPKLNRVLDAVWDTDGRTLLLIRRHCILVSILLNHTLESKELQIEFVCSVRKPSSYVTLYASQGIVSYQTALGRVINSILDSHDDEVKLAKLERDIHHVITTCSSKGDEGASLEVAHNEGNSSSSFYLPLQAQANILQLKLDYLRTILQIYSLSKCKEICQHLTRDNLFNFEPFKQTRDFSIEQQLNLIIWKLLAARALFTLNLCFARFIYKDHGLLVCARVLREIMKDAQTRCLDTKLSVKSRLLVLLDCSDINDDE